VGSKCPGGPLGRVWSLRGNYSHQVTTPGVSGPPPPPVLPLNAQLPLNPADGYVRGPAAAGAFLVIERVFSPVDFALYASVTSSAVARSAGESEPAWTSTRTRPWWSALMSASAVGLSRPGLDERPAQLAVGRDVDTRDPVRIARRRVAVEVAEPTPAPARRRRRDRAHRILARARGAGEGADRIAGREAVAREAADGLRALVALGSAHQDADVGARQPGGEQIAHDRLRVVFDCVGTAQRRHCCLSSMGRSPTVRPASTALQASVRVTVGGRAGGGGEHRL
jgi:hypothetical protein